MGQICYNETMIQKRQGMSRFNEWVRTLTTHLLFLSLFIPSPIQADDLEDFLEDSQQSKESILLDIEENVGANFNVVDGITRRQKAIDESLIIPPKYDKPRTFGNPGFFTAQLKEGSILRNLKNGKGVRIDKPIVVKAKSAVLGGNTVFIYDRSGNKRYETSAPNAVNIEHIVKMNPDIDPLVTYTDIPRYGAVERETNFSHFFSYHLEAIQTEYYSTIFRGTRQSANSNQLQLKSYFVKKDFPVQMGLNISAQLGFWEDPDLGTVTWSGLFFGPSIMKSFWRKKDSQWNLHLSGFRSIYHESQKSPDRHKYSTIGLQFEVEKEFETSYGPFTLGANYRWSRSSIKASSEFLQNESVKGGVTALGAYVGYRFNWML